MRYEEEILPHEGGETLAQVAQRSCGCPLPGSVQGQVGQHFEQPGLVAGVPAHSQGGWNWISSLDVFKVPSNRNHSMILMIALYSLAAISHNPSEQLVPLGIATNMSQHCTKPTRKLSPPAIPLHTGSQSSICYSRTQDRVGQAGAATSLQEVI